MKAAHQGRGHDVMRDAIAAKRALAYVPDNPDIYEFMTGMQYLAYLADIFEVPADQRARRIEELSHRLDLADALADPIASYSHGMQQKLVIIGALVHSRACSYSMSRLWDSTPSPRTSSNSSCTSTQAGAAVFFSSHVLEVVEKLCNKLTIIRAGEVLAQGTTEQVRGDNALEDVFLELVEQEA